jgi:hypothetical protein
MKLVVVGISVLALVCVYKYSFQSNVIEASQYQSHTSPAMLATCFTAYPDLSTSTDACIENMVTALLHASSTAELMRYIIASSSPRTITNNCHTIAHQIGAATLNSSPSIEDALARCTEDCRSGCIHGAIGAEVEKELGTTYPDDDIAHADIATIERIGARYCAKGSSLCHGIGHVLFINSQNYNSSLTACDEIGGRNKEACYEGVFMESLGGEESLILSSSTIQFDPQDFEYPCTTVAAQYHYACYQYVSFLQLGHLDTESTASGSAKIATIVDACKKLDTVARAQCIEGFAHRGNSKYFTDAYTLESLCESFPQLADRIACTVGLAERYKGNALFNKAHLYCSQIKESARQDRCFEKLN